LKNVVSTSLSINEDKPLAAERARHVAIDDSGSVVPGLATEKLKAAPDEKRAKKRASVFSGTRTDQGGLPAIDSLPLTIQSLLDRRNQSDGLIFLSGLPDGVTSLVFFDPEYRGVMDYQGYGNEGERQKGRAALAQMPEQIIREFIVEIARILTPMGHLMLWVDKYHLAEGVGPWLDSLGLKVVDLVTWDKGRIGMGYRTRRKCEYLIVIQKLPLRAKGVWTAHDIPDVWLEKLAKVPGGHAHVKPEGLQAALIAATTAPGGLVIDPAAGSFSVMRAAHSVGRRFLGCDLRG
jgi:site-specific DNA-methyltransferase (adenine-specific)